MELMDSEAIEEAAAHWFAKRQSDTWTDADQARFDAWREQSTAHKVAYIRLDAAWQHAARMRALNAGVPPGVIPPRGMWRDSQFSKGARRQVHASSATNPADSKAEVEPALLAEVDGVVGGRRKSRIYAIAACLLLTIAAGAALYASLPLSGDRYSTPVGGIDNVALSDGSHITLNTDSRIRVELLANERRIALSRGEAFFEVAKDPARPFVVEVGSKRVTAVGTKFSVRREGEDIRVLVTEGKVRVDTVSAVAAGKGTVLPAATNDVAQGRGVLLVAGNEARTAREDVLIRAIVEPAEAEQMLSWRSGYLVFHETPLIEAVAQFNRYNTRKIVIEDSAIATILIDGNFRFDNIEGFLWLIQGGFAIDVERNEESVVLKAR